MSVALSLYFENDGKDKQHIYHKAGEKGEKTPSFDLDAILGNDDGHFRWGLSGISRRADDMELKGSILKAKLFTSSKEWVPADCDLSKYVRLAKGKNVLESFNLPAIPADRQASLKEQNEKLLTLIEEWKKADTTKLTAEELKKQADDIRKEKEAKDKEQEEWRIAETKRDAEEAERVQREDQQSKERQAMLKARAELEDVLHRASEEEIEEEKAAVDFEKELTVLGAIDKTSAEQEEEYQLALSRLPVEHQLSTAQQTIAELSTSISSREVNISKAYGDYAWLNAEVKERDLKMALMFQEKSELFRELSASHERFSAVDRERLAMSKELKRFTAVRKSLEEKCATGSKVLVAVEAQYRAQEAELKQASREKSRVESQCITLESEIDILRRENLSLQTLTSDLKAENNTIHTRLVKANTTIRGNTNVIEHSKVWKVYYEREVEAVKTEIANINIEMSKLEQKYQETSKAFRAAQIEKEEIQSSLTIEKYSKAEFESRVIVIEAALLSARTELSQLSKSFEEKDDELRALVGVKTVLERRLSDLSLSHAHERNVSRNASERLFHVQASVAENVDWMYDISDDLTEESKYLYLHYLHHGAASGLELDSKPSLPRRLPSYGSAVNSRTASPDRTLVSIPEHPVEIEAASSALKTVERSPSASVEVVDVKVSEVPNGKSFQPAAIVPGPAVIAA